MPKPNVITAIDLGTDKCVTLIATSGSPEQKLRIVGVAAVPSRGMKRSSIVDLEQVMQTITESVDAAERMAGFEVQSAYVSVSGAHINSRNSKGVVAVAAPDQEITRLDVERVIEAARAISLPTDQQVMHVIPRDFKVDSQEGVKDPVGMTGVRLESEAHIITGLSTSLKNLEKCLHDLGLDVDDFVFSGLAAAQVVLTETEKELGVAVVDIGAGTTSVCVYVDGCLEYSGAVPVGARHVTQDIALGCRISIDQAEKIKMALASAEIEVPQPMPGESKEDFNRRRKKADQLDLTSVGIYDFPEKLSKRTLVEGIMMPRMKEIFQMISDQLNKHDLLSQIPAGLVLSGGGAETVRISEVARRVMNLPVRVGAPTQLEGLVGDINKPLFATSVGLVVYGWEHGGSTASVSKGGVRSLVSHFNWRGVTDKISKILKSILP